MPFGVAVKAKNDRFGWRPRAANVDARASCGSSGASVRLGLLGKRQLRLDRSRSEGGLQIFGRLARLARMRFVDDDGEPPMAEVLDLVER